MRDQAQESDRRAVDRWRPEVDVRGVPKPTVVDRVVEMLAAAGIRRVYGVSGASLAPVAAAVRTRPGITWLSFATEASAVSAAAAEAELTGRLTVCAANGGSGNLRLLDRLHEAHRGHRPVLAIAMHASTREIGRGDDEIHPEPFFRQCSGFCELVSHSHQMPRLLQRAVESAVARPGVAVLVLPADVALRGATVTEASDALRPWVSERAIDGACGAGLAESSTLSRVALHRLAAPYGIDADDEMGRSGFARLLSIITARKPGSVVVCSPETGLAEAVGVQLSHASRLVFALLGDAAVTTLAGDLSTLQRMAAPVKVVVLRKRATPANPSHGAFAMVAEAFGVPGLVARTAEETSRALDRAVAYSGPALVEAIPN